MKATVISICLLLCGVSVFSQTRYYTKTETIHKEGYTYQCDVDGALYVRLYNKNNKWTYAKMEKRVFDEPFEVTPGTFLNSPLLVKDNQMKKSDKIIKDAVRELLAPYKERLTGRQLILSMPISSDTGRIMEVDFAFHQQNPHATIPVSVYREMELRIVGLQYTLSDMGKTFNYVYNWFPIDF